MSDAAAEYEPVSVETDDGRILSGVGVTEDALRDTIDASTDAAPVEPVAETAPEPSAPPAQPEKQTRGQKRYAELTYEREQAQREAADAKRERDELKAQIDALKQAPAPSAPPAPAPAPVAQPEGERFTFPTYDAAVAANPQLSWEDWLDARQNALTDFKIARLDLDASIRTRLEADQAARTLADKYSHARTLAAQRYPDFQAVTQTAAHLNRNDWPMERLQAIGGLEPAQHAHVLYALAKDAALANRLRTMDPMAFGLELARLIPSSGVAPTASTPAPVSFVAPPPYQPVGGGSKTTARSFEELAVKATQDYDSSGIREHFAAEREKERKSRR